MKPTKNRKLLPSHLSELQKTDQVRAELAALAQSSGGAVIRKSLEGIVTGWDTSAERLFGYRAWQMVGRPAILLVPPDRQAEEARVLERLRRGERVESYATVRKAKSGQRLAVSLNLSLLANGAGVIEVVSLVS